MPAVSRSAVWQSLQGSRWQHTFASCGMARFGFGANCLTRFRQVHPSWCLSDVGIVIDISIRCSPNQFKTDGPAVSV
ncbi:hypothetical protein XspCFBP7912_07805 [Xanthomonas sp. CFBP 7912]|nr:hypothetical protein XspCFBP7912_07805 [Xanthomonas sp. CFBP 7912]RJS03261.1 hypothetical protein XnspCFBP7698_08555 [Xanthomonas sp. CFBP 7698]